MSRLSDLIAEYCPEGVITSSLGGFVQERQSRAGSDNNLPVFGISNSSGFVATEKIFSTSRASADRSNYKVVRPKDFAYNPSRINVGSIAMLNEESGVIVSPMYTVVSVSPRLDPRYLEHFIRSSMFQAQVLSSIEVGARFRFTFDSLAKIRVAVPPLEVQREIVSVLDKFTELEAELEAELYARRRQYEHYRHDLVGKEPLESREWVTLASVASVRTGTKPSFLASSGPIPYVNAGNEPSGFTNAFNAPGGCITIPSRGQGAAGHVGYQDSEFWCGPLCYRVESTSPAVITKFLYFFLRNIQDELIGLRKIGSIPAVNKSDLGEVLIPLVDMDQQNRTVALLDKFEALVNDLSIGLPAELATRRKHYEYYRNKLLTFKVMENA